jgi:phosphonate transport system substrate-binding protein
MAVALRDRPELAGQLRVIESLGPSPIQPVVASRRLPAAVRAAVRDVLLGLGEDPAARPHLERALVERFAPVSAATYDPIRDMLEAAEAAGFLALR